MKYELTDKDFEFFRAECEKWIDRLGLKSWRFFYQFRELEDKFGEMRTDHYGRIAVIRLNRFWDLPDYDVDKTKQIKSVALHEVLEVLLSPLRAVSDVPYEGEYDKETHRIIRHMENYLLKE